MSKIYLYATIDSEKSLVANLWWSYQKGKENHTRVTQKAWNLDDSFHIGSIPKPSGLTPHKPKLLTGSKTDFSQESVFELLKTFAV